MPIPAAMLLARAEKDVFLLPRMANRHGLIAGATGTGKTITLRLLAEGFSRMGVPGALYWGELLGAVLMFIGFIRATTPMGQAVPQRAVRVSD